MPRIRGRVRRTPGKVFWRTLKSLACETKETKMRGTLALTVLLGAATLGIDAAAADLGGVLDRVRHKADEAAAETRELRRDVETAADIEGQTQAEVNQAQREAEQAVPTEQGIEGRARGEIESTEGANAVRGVERDVDRAVTADERTEAAARSEVGRVEREVERQTDVEGRARAEVASSDPAVAAREAERETDAITSADERAEAEIERDLDSVERAIEDLKDPL